MMLDYLGPDVKLYFKIEHRADFDDSRHLIVRTVRNAAGDFINTAPVLEIPYISDDTNSAAEAQSIATNLLLELRIARDFADKIRKKRKTEKADEPDQSPYRAIRIAERIHAGVYYGLPTDTLEAVDDKNEKLVYGDCVVLYFPDDIYPALVTDSFKTVVGRSPNTRDVTSYDAILLTEAMVVARRVGYSKKWPGTSTAEALWKKLFVSPS